MRLLIDIGNSRVKWGWRDGDRWLARHAAPIAEFGAAFIAANDAAGDCLICSVASESASAAVEQIVRAALPGMPLRWFRASAEAGGLSNRYDQPQALGADRFAAAIGARGHCADGALVIAAFGTMTTIDTVSADHAFVGGVILPGVETMLRAMAERGARLPAIETIDATLTDFPTHTAAAMREGVRRAQAGAVRDCLRLSERHYGATQLILTGGAAAQIAPALPAGAQVVDNLVLDGLALVAAADASPAHPDTR